MEAPSRWAHLELSSVEGLTCWAADGLHGRSRACGSWQAPFTLSHNIVVCSRTIHKTKNLQARQRGRRVFPNSCLLAALFLYPAMQGKGVTQISQLVEHDPWVIGMREPKSPMSRWHGHPLCRHLSPDVCCRHGPGAINGQGLQGLLSACCYGRSIALCSQDTHKAIKVPGRR